MKHKPRKSKLVTHGSTLYTLESADGNSLVLQRQRVYADLPREEPTSPLTSARKYKLIGRKRQAETPLLKPLEDLGSDTAL